MDRLLCVRQIPQLWVPRRQSAALPLARIRPGRRCCSPPASRREPWHLRRMRPGADPRWALHWLPHSDRYLDRLRVL